MGRQRADQVNWCQEVPEMSDVIHHVRDEEKVISGVVDIGPA